MAEVPAGLPFPLAYVYADVVEQWESLEAPGGVVLCVYHLVDAVEVSAKFIVASGVGVLGLDREQVRDAVGRLGVRPSLDLWLRALGRLREPLSKESSALGAALAAASAVLLDLDRNPAWDLPGERAWRGLRGLRNWLAHAGSLREPHARTLVMQAVPAFRESMKEIASALLGARIIRVDSTGVATAVPSALGDRLEAGPERSANVAGLESAAPGLYLELRGGPAQIWPIVRYEPLKVGARASPDALTDAQRLVHQVFVRLEGASMQYGPLDAASVVGVGGPHEARAYAGWLAAAKAGAGFWSDAAALSAARVGRDNDLERIRVGLRAARTEALGRGRSSARVMFGTVGRGKSILAATCAVEQREAAESRVLLHMFIAGDPRCSLAAFVDLALSELPSLDDEPAVLDPAPRIRRRRLATRMRRHRPLVICDGLDELERAEPGAVEALRELADASESVWLFCGRPEAAVVTTLRGVEPVFVTGLPEMTADDLREMVLVHAAPVVRDAIASLDEVSDNDRLTNPYLTALIERAGGSPLYLMLTLQLLAREPTPAAVEAHLQRVIEQRDWLPADLGALYRRLLDELGTGDFAAAKTPVLCYLAHAREPIGPGALAQLVFLDSRPATASRIALCQAVLDALRPLLREEIDADGNPGYRLDHDSLRHHAATSPEVSETWRSSLDRLADLGLNPGLVHDSQLRRHLYRNGVAYATEAQRPVEAADTLCSFGYLHSRLQELGVTALGPLHEDFSQITAAIDAAGADPRGDALTTWREFLRKHAHLLERADRDWGPDRILHQLAFEHGTDTIVTIAAERWSQAHGRPPLHLAWRPRQPTVSAQLEVTLRCQASVNAILALPDSRLAACSGSNIIFWDLERFSESGRLEGHTEAVGGILIDKAGRLVSWGGDGTVRIWDIVARAELRRLESDAAAGAVRGVKMLDDGGLLARHANGTCRLYPSEPGSESISLEGSVTVLRDGRLAAACEDGTVRVWDRTGRVKISQHTHSSARVWDLVELPSGAIASMAQTDREVTVWDPVDGAVAMRLHVECRDSDRVELDSLTTLRNGHRILASCTVRPTDYSGTRSLVQVWDSVTGEQLHLLEGHTSYIRRPVELSDGRVASYSSDHTVRIWDPATGDQLHVLAGHTEPVEQLSELRDGRLASISDDRMVRIWDPSTGKSLDVLSGHTAEISGLVELAEDRLATCARDNTIRIWELSGRASGAGAPPTTDQSESRWIQGIVIVSPTRLAEWRLGGDAVQILDLGDGEVVQRLPGDLQTHIVSLPGGRAASSAPSGIRIWDIGSGREIRHMEDLSLWNVQGLRVLPTGNLLSWGMCTIAWNPDTGEKVYELPGHAGSAVAEDVLQLPDGRLLSWSGHAIRVWIPERQAQQWELECRYVAGATLLDEGLLASWCHDASRWSWESDRPKVGDLTVHIWDLNLGIELRRLEGHTAEVRGVRRLRDGTLASWAKDETTRIWNPVDGTELRRLEGSAFFGLLELPDGRLATRAPGGVALWERGVRQPTQIDVPGELWDIHLLGARSDVLLAVSWESLSAVDLSGPPQLVGRAVYDADARISGVSVGLWASTDSLALVAANYRLLAIRLEEPGT